MENRWFGPYVIVEISKTSCLVKNSSGKTLKQRINLCQLKPYRENDEVQTTAFLSAMMIESLIAMMPQPMLTMLLTMP